MNEILQKRIEEAAKRYAWSHDTIGVDKETFHTEASQKHPIPIDKHVRVPIQHEMEIAFKCAAHFILNNQWISVEEALPEFKGNFSDYYIIRTESGWCAVTMYYRTSEKEYWWNFENVNAKVTHWMPIPSLEGGDK
jgi:hypothetical protein